MHLHHDGDTARDAARATSRDYLDALRARTATSSRDPDGRLRYAFIHGNWCLANARADGRWCGVDDEIPLLFDTGCYADFTFPSAPDECQPNIVNQIYWPDRRPVARRAPTSAASARASASVRHDRILMIEGPLALARRPGRLRVRIENAAVTARRSADAGARRAPGSSRASTSTGRPEWVFVKVHTHGAPETQAASLLGDGGRALHRDADQRYNDGARWRAPLRDRARDVQRRRRRDGGPERRSRPTIATTCFAPPPGAAPRR